MTDPPLDLRYPIGKCPRPEDADLSSIPAVINALEALLENLRAAVDGLNETQLDTPYREGGWTIRQVVHHLADSHISAYLCTRKALTEDWPMVSAYDANTWANLGDTHLPVETSLEILEPLHRRWTAVFRSLSPEQWTRGYRHPSGTSTTVERILFIYEWHSRHHVAHITELRKRHGW